MMRLSVLVAVAVCVAVAAAAIEETVDGTCTTRVERATSTLLAHAFRGNTYAFDSAAHLASVWFYATGFTTRDVRYVVAEVDSVNEEITEVLADVEDTLINLEGPWFESPALDLDLSAGKTYMVGVYVAAIGLNYNYGSTDPFPEDFCFGQLVGRVFDSDIPPGLPSGMVPPDPKFAGAGAIELSWAFGMSLERVCTPDPCAENAFCNDAGSCECREGWTNFPACDVPMCDSPCGFQEECIVPGPTCTCVDGYARDPETGLCTTPVCSEDCETEYENQECVAPDTCGCTEGWSMDESGVCNMPECSNCFVNDECLAPGDCTCIEGWTRSASGHCDKAICAYTCPINEGCPLPGEACDCINDYTRDPESGRCTAFECTSGCGTNEICTGPDTCACDEGWVHNESSGACDIMEECPDGYEGWPSCDVPLCPNCDGDHSSCLAPEVCVCDQGWGPSNDCSSDSCTEPCGTNKECVAFETCDCSAGWGGSDCLTPLCDPACAGAASCVGVNVCQCDPLWGPEGACDSQACSSCPLNAHCVGYETCVCDDGWTGVDGACDVPQCDGGCPANSICTAPDTCTCIEGYGPDAVCDTPLCPDCDMGACVAPGDCVCAQGWGPDDECSSNSCEAPCPSNQECTGYETCSCIDGWAGANCDIPLCEAGCPGLSACTAPDTCECLIGWSGPSCTVPVCTLDCEAAGASCIAPNVCVCADGMVYEGGADCAVTYAPTTTTTESPAGSTAAPASTTTTTSAPGSTSAPGTSSPGTTAAPGTSSPGTTAAPATGAPATTIAPNTGSPGSTTTAAPATAGPTSEPGNCGVCPENSLCDPDTNNCTCVSGWGPSASCDGSLDCICDTFHCGTPSCGTNQQCVGPHTCECAPGWGPPGICSFAECDTACPANSQCTAPNTCTCLTGFSPPGVCDTFTGTTAANGGNLVGQLADGGSDASADSAEVKMLKRAVLGIAIALFVVIVACIALYCLLARKRKSDADTEDGKGKGGKKGGKKHGGSASGSGRIDNAGTGRSTGRAAPGISEGETTEAPTSIGELSTPALSTSLGTSASPSLASSASPSAASSLASSAAPSSADEESYYGGYYTSSFIGEASGSATNPNAGGASGSGYYSYYGSTEE